MFTLNLYFSKKFQCSFTLFFYFLLCSDAQMLTLPVLRIRSKAINPWAVDLEAVCHKLARGSRATISPSCWWPADEIHSTVKRISYWVRVSEWAAAAESLFVSGIDQGIFSIIWIIILFEAVTVRNLLRTPNLQHKHGWILEENEQRQQLCAISFVCIINVLH